MKCPFCQKEAVWCENKEIYGKNYGKSYMCWLCKPCDAYVGCHCNTQRPLGTMANKELREWRMKAHAAFDPLWQKYPKNRKGRRGQEYEWLAKKMKVKEIHIGESNIETCKKIIEICSNLKTPPSSLRDSWRSLNLIS